MSQVSHSTTEIPPETEPRRANDKIARTLYLVQVDQKYDPVRDIAIDPWCFIGQKFVEPDWDNIRTIDPFPTLDEVGKEHKKLSLLLHHLVERYANQLNKRHTGI